MTIQIPAPFFAKRLVIAAGLAGVMLSSAVLPAPAAGVDPGPVTAHPVTTAAPAAGAPSAGSLALSAMNVQAGGMEATVSFTSSAPATASVSVQPVAASTTGTPTGAHPVHLPVGGGVGELPVVMGAGGGSTTTPSYQTSHTLKLPNLKPNTAYQATVSVQAQDGSSLTQQVTFTTARERIRVTVESIDITHGGALIGDPSPMWTLGLQWGAGSGFTHLPSAYGETATCFPSNGYPNGLCQYGSYGDGAFQPKDTFGQPLSWVFAEENFDSMPATFQFASSADVSGLLDNLLGSYADLGKLEASLFGADTSDPSSAPVTWQVPQGLESASATRSTVASVSDFGIGGFYSTVTYKIELFYDNLSYPAP